MIELDPIRFHGPEGLAPSLIAYPPDAPIGEQRLVGFHFMDAEIVLDPDQDILTHYESRAIIRNALGETADESTGPLGVGHTQSIARLHMQVRDKLGGDREPGLLMDCLRSGVMRRTVRGDAKKFVLAPDDEAVLNLIACGHSQNECAERLFLAPGTIANHLRHIHRTTKLHGGATLIATALVATRDKVGGFRLGPVPPSSSR